MFELNIFLFSIIVIPYTIIYIKRYKLTPVSFFLVMEIGYFYGICFAPKGQLDVAIKLETIYVVALISFILGVELCKRVRFPNETYICDLNLQSVESFKDNNITRDQRITIWVIIAVSILACSYLFVSGGVNVFLRSLMDFFSESSSTYKNERASYFSVGGMGYIYQFRAILLPILSVYIVFCDKKKLPKFISIPLIVLMIVFLLGTGQRNAFIFFCIIVFMYSLVMYIEFKVHIFTKGQYIFFGAAALLFLIALTLSNGRVSSDSNRVLGALQSLADRALSVNQRTAINAFSYIDTQPTVWGYDWMMTLRDLLPGKSGYMTVSRITYYLAYGSYNGTGDPCIWGSAWYNFHFIGVTIFPFVMGFAYHRVYKHMMNVKNKDRLYMLIYCGLSVYLGLWVYGTPMNLFNIGVVALFILRWILFTILNKRNVMETTNGEQ